MNEIVYGKNGKLYTNIGKGLFELSDTLNVKISKETHTKLMKRLHVEGKITRDITYDLGSLLLEAIEYYKTAHPLSLNVKNKKKIKFYISPSDYKQILHIYKNYIVDKNAVIDKILEFYLSGSENNE